MAAAVTVSSSPPPRETEYHGSPLTDRSTTRIASSPRGSPVSDRDTTRSASDCDDSVRESQPLVSRGADVNGTQGGFKHRSSLPRNAKTTLGAEHQHPQHEEQRQRQHANGGFSGRGDDGVRGVGMDSWISHQTTVLPSGRRRPRSSGNCSCHRPPRLHFGKLFLRTNTLTNRLPLTAMSPRSSTVAQVVTCRRAAQLRRMSTPHWVCRRKSME